MPRNVKPVITDMTTDERQLMMRMAVANRLTNHYEEMAERFAREAANVAEQFWDLARRNRLELTKEIKRKMHTENADVGISIIESFTKIQLSPDWEHRSTSTIPRKKV